MPGSARVSPDSFKSRRRDRFEGWVVAGGAYRVTGAELGNFKDEERATGFLDFFGAVFFATGIFWPKSLRMGMEI